MIDPQVLTDPLRCPSCFSPLVAGLPSCPHCGIALQGPRAELVWDLSVRAAALLGQRAQLIGELRRSAVSATSAAGIGTPAVSRKTSPPALTRETSARGTQQTLVIVGALLVALAALYFLIAGWGHLGIAGRSIVLATLTIAAVAAAQWALRAHLTNTAEALSAVALTMATLDAFAARAVDLGGLHSTPRAGFAAVCLLALAVAAKGWSRLCGLLVPDVASAVLAVGAGAAAADQLAEQSVLGGGAALVAAGAVLAIGVRRVWGRPAARTVAAAGAALLWLVGVLTSLVAGEGSSQTTRSLALAGVVTLAVAVAGWTARELPRPGQPGGELSLAAAAAAVAVGCAGVVCLTDGHVGLVSSCLAAAVLALATLGGGLRTLRSSWWSLAGGVIVGAALAFGASLLAAWDAGGRTGTTVVLLVVAVLAGVSAYVERFGQHRAFLRLDPIARRPLAALASVAACAASWSLPVTLRVDFEQAALVATGSAVAVALLATYVLRGGLRRDAEVVATAATVLALAGAASSHGSPGTLTLALLIAGLGAAAVSVAPDRRAMSLATLVLLVASLWTWLGQRHVHTVEVYTLPAAVGLALTMHLIKREVTGAMSGVQHVASSWLVWGPSLVVALVPSLVRVLDDGAPADLRALLVGVAALAMLLWGVAARLQAQLLVGAGVLLVDAAAETLPLAASLPGWVTIGGAGLLLLGVGATYERRLEQARETVSRLNSLS